MLNVPDDTVAAIGEFTESKYENTLVYFHFFQSPLQKCASPSSKLVAFLNADLGSRRLHLKRWDAFSSPYPRVRFSYLLCPLFPNRRQLTTQSSYSSPRASPSRRERISLSRPASATTYARYGSCRRRLCECHLHEKEDGTPFLPREAPILFALIIDGVPWEPFVLGDHSMVHGTVCFGNSRLRSLPSVPSFVGWHRG
jgi:hypothetical protein